MSEEGDEKLMVEMTSCPICCNPFNDRDRKPKLSVVCGHTFCEPCWENHRKCVVSRMGKDLPPWRARMITCPECRQYYNCEEQLITNHMVQGMAREAKVKTIGKELEIKVKMMGMKKPDILPKSFGTITPEKGKGSFPVAGTYGYQGKPKVQPKVMPNPIFQKEKQKLPQPTTPAASRYSTMTNHSGISKVQRGGAMGGPPVPSTGIGRMRVTGREGSLIGSQPLETQAPETQDTQATETTQYPWYTGQSGQPSPERQERDAHRRQELFWAAQEQADLDLAIANSLRLPVPKSITIRTTSTSSSSSSSSTSVVTYNRGREYLGSFQIGGSSSSSSTDQDPPPNASPR